MFKFVISGLFYALILLTPAHAKGHCTLVLDVDSNQFVHQSGEICDHQYSPASTFKLAIALMGFDQDVLAGPKSPVVEYDPAIAAALKVWRQSVWPRSWLKHSVIWYSQYITGQLGERKFSDYVQQFQYGNQDVSGDLTHEDGLMRAWISSSLKISPREQAQFLHKILTKAFDLRERAYQGLHDSMQEFVTQNGHHGFGKTGTGLRLNSKNKRTNVQFGWFVGWVEQASKTYVFVRLVDDGIKRKSFAGAHTKQTLLADLDGLLTQDGKN